MTGETMDRPRIGFTHQDDLFLRAVELDCIPVWARCQWECRCPEAVHGVSIAYPAITTGSLERAKTEL